MKIIFVLALFIITISSGCKKCLICTDKMTVTRTKPTGGYPKTFESIEEFCGRERNILVGTETNSDIIAPGDTIIYFMERTCIEKK